MTRTFRMTGFRRLGDATFKALLSRGAGPGFMALLTVKGRHTGRLYTTPVRPVERAGSLYLVSPYGVVNWVLNARAAGQVTLQRKGQTHAYQVVECDPEESGPVLKKYLRVAPIVLPYFDAKPGDPPERFAAEADRHPVFRVGEIVNSAH